MDFFFFFFSFHASGDVLEGEPVSHIRSTFAPCNTFNTEFSDVPIECTTDTSMQHEIFFPQLASPSAVFFPGVPTPNAAAMQIQALCH